MAFTIHRVEYFHTTVRDEPGTAYSLLSALADQSVYLFAFTAVPVTAMQTQLTLFPQDSGALVSAARKAGLALQGPHRALLVQGDDELGALARIHAKLYEGNINVSASNGVTDGRGSYGYIIYVRPEEFERAARALEV